MRGDVWAKGVLYRRHARDVANLAARLLGRRADALDVVQDVFVDALRSMATMRDPSAFRGWLMTSTVRQAHRRFRRQRLLRSLGMDRGLDDATLDLLAQEDVSAERRIELARASAVLAKQSPRARFAWMLHRVEGEAMPAVAEALECSLATVKREIQKVDLEIRSTLEEAE